jgi:flavin reductase (DIM6/NTAB) family NADH-FMN oxidoreductase RutF
MNQDAIAAVFHLYDPPLWLVTAAHHGRRGGLIATSAVRASIVAEQPRMLIAIARHHHTWELIAGSGRFALHLLPVSGLDAVWRFGLQSGHQQDKFADLPTVTTPDGNPRYPDCVAWLDCRVEETLDIGDRSVYIAAVTAGAVPGNGPVLSVATLLRDAPGERRAELDRRYAADQTSDREAIQAWRRSRGLA